MKKRTIVIIVVLVVLAIAAIFGFRQLQQAQTAVSNAYQTATLDRGELTAIVGATGTVRPTSRLSSSGRLPGRLKISAHMWVIRSRLTRNWLCCSNPRCRKASSWQKPIW